ncbi:MAG: hypothetical protein AAF483_07030 [Planctomycetota bacterium]
MYSIKIELKNCGDVAQSEDLANASPCAWYLASKNRREWTSVLLHSLAKNPLQRAYVLPVSKEDPTPSGIVCLQCSMEQSPIGAVALAPILLEAPSISDDRDRTQKALEQNLWLPQNAILDPMLSALELQKHMPSLSSCVDFVWLPSIGFVGLEIDDQIHLNDLLQPPHSSTMGGHWQQPPEFRPLPDRLLHFSLQSPPTIESVFGDESREIGGSLQTLRDAQEDEGKPSYVSKLRSKIAKQLEKWLHGNKRPPGYEVARGNSSRDKKPGILGPITNFLRESLQKERDSQIEKLLRMLDKNPDRALTFAIPMGEEMSAQQGSTTAGGSLTSHGTDFSLSGLTNNGPADYWDINDDARLRLLAAYREQARREITAGRHRRAAYVFAHLLCDLSSAANALESGKHYSEAAVIHEKLKRPREQARCLKLAGQYSAAAQVFEDIKDYESVGEVWLDAQSNELATEAFERAVAQALEKNHPLKAASILDTRLQRREEADAILWEQWPDGNAAIEAMKQSFAWYAEDGQHQKAIEKLSELAEVDEYSNRGQVAKITAYLANHYPDRKIQYEAEDLCRLSCSTNSDSDEIRSRLSQLRTISGLDSLVSDDIRRYLLNRPLQAPVLQEAKPSNSERIIFHRSEQRLQTSTKWLDAVCIGGELLLVTKSDKEIVFGHIVGPQANKTEFGYTRVDCSLHSGCSELRIHAVEDHGSWRIGLYYPAIPTKYIEYPAYPLGHPLSDVICHLDPAIGGQYRLACEAAGASWQLDRDQLRYASSGHEYSLDLGSQLTERIFRESGHVCHADSVTHLISCGQQIFLASGDLLLSLDNDQFEIVLKTDGHINNLATSLRHTTDRILAATSASLELLHLENLRVETISLDKAYAHACFLHGGRIAAVTGNQLEIYCHNRHKRMELCDTATLPSSAVLKLFSLSVDTLVITFQDGRVMRFLLKT